jgi:hypothetical protein
MDDLLQGHRLVPQVSLWPVRSGEDRLKIVKNTKGPLATGLITLALAVGVYQPDPDRLGRRSQLNSSNPPGPSPAVRPRVEDREFQPTIARTASVELRLARMAAPSGQTLRGLCANDNHDIRADPARGGHCGAFSLNRLYCNSPRRHRGPWRRWDGPRLRRLRRGERYRRRPPVKVSSCKGMHARTSYANWRLRHSDTTRNANIRNATSGVRVGGHAVRVPGNAS